MAEEIAIEGQEQEPPAGDSSAEADEAAQLTVDDDPGFEPHDGQPWWKVVSTWFRRLLVAIGGGGAAVLLAVAINRLLVQVIHYPLQKHPEVGGVQFTIIVAISGLGGFLVGMFAARARTHGRNRDKLFDRWSEFSAAAGGSLVAIYLGVIIGSMFGAFSNVHFHPGRLLAPLVVGIIGVMVKAAVDAFWSSVIQPRITPVTVSQNAVSAETTNPETGTKSDLGGV